ncbi:MAG: 4Fe-4S binding protein [Aquabacterium sp.]|nr:4Fe-4S binding protein [Aquabacterium sp.]
MSAERAAVLLQAAPSPEVRRLARLQRLRRGLQLGFFALFLVAPALNLLRFDLTETQLWVLGFRWHLGIDAFLRGEATATQAALSIIGRGILPALALVAIFMTVAYKYGRLYCGWLCPHFSLVESLNDLLHRATGKLSLWDRHATPRAGRQPDKRWWPLFALSCAVFGFLWAITLLTYLLPPALVWGNLVAGTLTPNQARFLVIASAVFTAEFLFARHLFCRYGCAVGLFQSLAWMANPKGLVIAFDRNRARDCRSCSTEKSPDGVACDHACPMRLAPRNIKRMMFACVQCGQCITECDSSHAAQNRAPNLEWKVGLDAVKETLRQRRQEPTTDR